MAMPASRRPQGKAPLGPRIFGGGALLLGLAVFYVALSDIIDAKDAEFSPTSAAFAPLVASGMWVVCSAIYFVRQLVKPTADYPVAQPPEAPEAEPGTDDSSPDADDAEPDTRDAADRADEDPTDVRWRAPALLVLALVGYVVALAPVGFVITTAALFFAVALIFGSRHYVRDAAIGVLLSVGIYLLFNYVLILSLPPGVLPL